MALLGSANATKNSLELCYEMVTVTRSLTVTRELREAFNALWAESKPIELDSLPDLGGSSLRLRRSRSFSRSASLPRSASLRRGRSLSSVDEVAQSDAQQPGTGDPAVLQGRPDPAAQRATERRPAEV